MIRKSILIKSLPESGRGWRLFDPHGGFEERVCTHWFHGLEIALAERDQAQIGPDQVDALTG